MDTGDEENGVIDDAKISLLVVGYVVISVTNVKNTVSEREHWAPYLTF